MDEAEVLWKELDLNSVLVSEHTRVKELLGLIYYFSFCKSSDDLSYRKYLRENYKDIKNWIQELKGIAGTSDRVERFCQTLNSCLEEAIDCKRDEGYFLSPSLLELIEQYRTSPQVIQETNFHGITYYESYLTRKIELFYEIGKQIGILNEREIFNSSVRVDRNVQETCDRVRAWVEDKLGFDLQRVNVYESFVGKYLKYCDRTFYEGVCEAALEEIGLRSGILKREKREEVSRVEIEIIIQWLQRNYGIKLPLLKNNKDVSLPYKPEWKVSTEIKNFSIRKNPFIIALKYSLVVCSLGIFVKVFVPDSIKIAERLLENTGLVGQNDQNIKTDFEEWKQQLILELRKKQLYPISPTDRM
ncbi:MAG: hypothetical protein CLLPBCKN_006910 [Chroococcidiopsis cubana SAG 39.79]|uniref:Uncharacterized protein n=1 Tax=Chroococcidiopsis cubana SAG 39.79 TaxID=388085 RepID=A0AB37UA04_9CYAN|nr:hypothetical protein [Chroococcidiopsis cubana]MDZ4877475.1 hypothetical protein [Chroococcidiopsis cubana SAG 39.79]PSB51940.1 hypothetical protein C7B79_36095 [Chroococcidiopsis cubana CCALA 043]RUT01178.1 hypothetical protein DSM107010_65890 [Chroococcidiopsis cubana SAG 39.79]